MVTARPKDKPHAQAPRPGPPIPPEDPRPPGASCHQASASSSGKWGQIEMHRRPKGVGGQMLGKWHLCASERNPGS